MRKKLIAILMSLAMILTFMPAIAFAEPGIELNAWLKWTEVDIDGNTPVIIAEAECPEGAVLSYSWKYRQSGEDPDAEWEELSGEDKNMLELTAGYGEGQYVCCVTASIDGNEVTKETDPCYYSEPDIAIAEGELSIGQSADILITKGWPTKCVKFVPDEEGEYAFSFAPSDESAELPTINCIVFDARGVQRGCCEAQPGEPVNANFINKEEAAYVAFFYEDENASGTYDATISVAKASDGGEGGGEGDESDFEGSFDYEGIQYYYSRSESVGEEFVKEVVKGETLSISPFDAYRIWYCDDNGDEITVIDPAGLFGDDVKYEWTRQNDEDEWDEIGHVAAYTKENADESDAGYYRCKVIYQDEELLNMDAEVVILGSVEINGETYTYSLESEGEAHVLGEEVTINSGARFRDSNGELVEPDGLFSKIEWYRISEEDEVQKEILVSGTGYDISPDDGSLHIDKVTGQDYGEYICRMYYDDEHYIESFASLQMGVSQDMLVHVGLSELEGVGQRGIIYSRVTDATPGAKLTYEWCYRDLDSDDPSYTGPEEGYPIDGETAPTIEPKYGDHYYHCNVTASMKGYEDPGTVGSNMNYITEKPRNLDPSGQSFVDDTGGRISASLGFDGEASEYYSFKPAANKVYELTATCNSSITDPVEIAVESFNSNGVKIWDYEYDESAKCTIDPSVVDPVSVLTFESGGAADPVYFAPWICSNGSGSADITFEITEIGNVPVYHVVEFETNSNEIMPSQLVKDGEKLTPESEPYKKGCIFSGWYEKDPATGKVKDKPFNFDNKINKDTFLYAKWEVAAKPKLSKTSFTYNGKVQTPTVSIAGLKSGTDFKVSWSKGRKDVGTYTATITLQGKYLGTKKLTYTILPKGTTINNPAGGKKAITVKWAKQSAKMSKATITGYQIQYSTNSKFKSGNKTVPVKGFKTTSKKIGKLKAKTKYYVRVRTYMETGGKTYCSEWSKTKSVRTK